MATKSNWASRPHSPPGSDGAVNEHKGLAMNVSPPKPKRTVMLNQTEGASPGRIMTPGWFSTKK